MCLAFLFRVSLFCFRPLGFFFAKLNLFALRTFEVAVFDMLHPFVNYSQHLEILSEI